MPNETDNRTRIEAALRRVRFRWLASAVINAGGRWAVLPAAGVALVAIVLALAGVRSLWLLVPLSVLGLAGIAGALLFTLRVYSRPGVAGAPDWTLLLDRVLGLDDALPTWCETGGAFHTSMESRIAAGLDPALEKQAAPPRRWGGLAVALLLALMPLIFWQPSPEPPPEQVAESAPENEGQAGGPGAGRGPGGGGEGGEGEAPGEGESVGEGETSGGGQDGEVHKRPDGSRGEGGAGEKPDDVEPRPARDNPPSSQPDLGEKPRPDDRQPETPDATDIESDLTKVKPKAADGETRTEPTSRWVYNPDADKLEGAKPEPRDINHPGEKAVPRTKMTRTERELIEKTYRKLYE
jgi:hypothetical protein